MRREAAGDPLLDDVDALVDGGRRAPGSDAERRAARHLVSRLGELGHTADTEAVDAYPSWPLAYALFAALSVAGSAVSVSVPVAGAALALAGTALTLLEAGVLLPTVRRLLGRRASQNVVSWGDRDRPGALVLVAHYDAGRGGLAHSARMRHRLRGLSFLFWSQAMLLILCLLRLAGLDGTALAVVQFVPTVLLIAAIGLLADVALSGTKGGENDNASGVALALRLAAGGEARLEHFGLHVLFTGANKAANAGMRSFLRRHRRALERRRTVFLNLDEVGAGSVCWTRREGPLVSMRSHVALVGLCEEVAEDGDEPGHAIVNRESSDGYAARAAGLPSITLTCRDRRDRAQPSVDAEAIERAEAFCAELMARIDSELGPELPGRDARSSE